MVILYADDDRDDGELLIEALGTIDPSIECQLASDGKEAIQWLNESHALPDCIFLDVNMPVMDGRECLSELKSNDRLKTIPVIMYSTTKDEEEIASLYELGAADFILKPTRFDVLCESLNQAIGRLNHMLNNP